MKKIFLAFALIVLTKSVFAQKNYLIIYDKLADKFTYQEMVYTKGKFVEGKKMKSPPKVELGDVITLRIVNFNEMITTFNTEKPLLNDATSKKSNPVLSTIAGLGISSFGAGSVTEELIGGLSSARSRGSQAMSPELTAAFNQLEEYRTQAKEEVSLLKEYFDATQVIYSQDLTLEQIKAQYINKISTVDTSKIDEMAESVNQKIIEFDATSYSSEQLTNEWKKLQTQLKEVNKLIEVKRNLPDITDLLNNIDFVDEKTIEVAGDGSSDNKELNNKEISSVTYFLKFYSNIKDTQDSTNYTRMQLKIGNESYDNGKIIFTRKLDLPVRGAYKPTWSTGVYLVTPFEGRYSFTEVPSEFGDSITFKKEKIGGLRPSLATNIVFDFKTGKSITPNVTIGFALSFLPSQNQSSDFNSEQLMNFTLGGGLKFKKISFLSFNAGFAYCQTIELNKDIIPDVPIESSSRLTDNPLKKVFKPGMFFGVNLLF